MTHLKNKELFVALFLYLIILIMFFINSFNITILNLIFWSLMIFYLKMDIKKNYVRFNKNRKYIIGMILISSVHAILYFYMGFAIGFSRSPFSHDPIIILKNIIMEIIPIIGIEYTRSIVVTRNKNNRLAIVLLTIILTLLEINYNTLFSSITNIKEMFEYFCSNILPIIICEIFYTYLALKGSYQLVLIYRLFKELLIIFLPIIPDTNWFLSGTDGILLPCIVYIIFEFFISNNKRNYRKKKENIFEKIIYILTIFLLIILICFMLGIFKYEPIAILSSSMQPTFSRGDVIIFKKLNDDELNKISKNTIIIYAVGNQHIAHRVIDSTIDNNMVLYMTKGDNNNVADTDLVDTTQIQGAYVFHIKYIGLPSVWLYELFNSKTSLVSVKEGG